jgi:hypothetical protein
MKIRSRGFAGLAGCFLALAGCSGGHREAKAPGVAIWIGPGARELDLGSLSRLADQGVTEYFVESGRLEWDGGRPRLVEEHPPRAARQERTTLVVTGSWPSAGIDAAAAATALAAQIDGLRLAAERAGRLPIGVHLDLDVEGGWADYARALKDLRAALDDRLYLSASLSRADLDQPEIADRIAPLDFVVGFLYGQRPGEKEDTDAWDFQQVEQAANHLDALGRPWYLGAVTLGVATWRGGRGSVRGVSSELDLGGLVRDGRLELKRGFSLEGIDRQVYEFTARSPLVVGAWALSTGDSVRVVRAATSNVEELLRRCGAWSQKHMLGQVFWRLPTAGERMSLTAANLADALAPAPSLPALDLLVERTAAGRDQWQLRLTLTDTNDESTDLGFFDANYVDLSVEHARIADVSPGDFSRFELSAGGERATMRALREADTVRLFAPIVEGRQRLVTGPIVLQLTGREAVVRTSGRFLRTDGEYAVLEPREWTFGSAR